MTELKERAQEALAEKKAEELPAVQWDRIACQLIKEELAPKGFSEVKHGPWKGSVKSNIEFLPRQTVVNCQKIAVQLVRAYRQKAKARVSTIIKEIDTWVKEDQKELAACRFWEFRKKTELRYKIRSLLGQGGSASRILQELDNISIK